MNKKTNIDQLIEITERLPEGDVVNIIHLKALETKKDFDSIKYQLDHAKSLIEDLNKYLKFTT